MRAHPSRRAVLLLALLAASCATQAPPVPHTFPPLDFSYLLALRLNVADIQIVSRYVPSGAPPDVSGFDPIQPVAALRLMAEQRLEAAGTAGQARFIINDASLIQQGDLITGSMSVELDIIGASGTREGYAQARVTRQLAGAAGDLPAALYQLTSDMMTRMNVEFEYQLRHSLSAWLLPDAAVQSPVQETPLTPEGSAPPTPLTAPGPSAPIAQPQSLAPPSPPPFVSPGGSLGVGIPGPTAPMPLMPPMGPH